MNPIITTQDPTQKSNLLYGGTINVGGTPPKTDIKAFNQQMVNAQPGQSNFKIPPVPPVVSNANVVTKIPEITGKHTEQVNKSGSTPPLPGTTAYTQANTQTQTPPTGTSDTYTLPQGAVDQGNGTVLYQGRYFSKDALTNPENIAGLANYNLDKKEIDDALKSQLDAINKRFEQYKQTQEKINTSQVGGVRNALLQSEGGNRGSVAQFAAATSDDRVRDIMEEGQKALQELDIQRDQLLSAAKDAYRTQNYKLLDTLNAQIEKTVADKREVLKKKSEEIEKETKQAEKDAAIAEEVGKGIFDPATIMANLKAKGISATAKETADSVAALTGIGGTGIRGEYNYALSQGWKGTGDKSTWFTQYQTEDENRKIRVAAASQNPDRILTATEAQALGVPFGTTASQAYGKTVTKPPTEAQNREAGYAKRMSEANPIIDLLEKDIVNMNPFKFSYEKSLENTTIGNTMVSDLMKQMRQAQRNFINAKLRQESGAVISPTEFENAEKQYFPQPGDDEKTLAQKRQNRLTAQNELIRSAGPAYGAEESTPSILEQAQQTEQQAETSFDTLMKSPNPNTVKYYKALKEEFGRIPTAKEYFERFPEEMPKVSGSVSVTDPKKGIVGNINLKGYATDPNQIKAVATIYQQVPETDNALDYTKFIKSISPKSPIKGEDIIQVADTFQLDPKILIALMQHESNMGTSSVALANNNYGGITWSESYARNNPGVTKGTPRPKNEGGYYVKFATPLDGLMAQAKLLSNRKIA